VSHRDQWKNDLERTAYSVVARFNVVLSSKSYWRTYFAVSELVATPLTISGLWAIVGKIAIVQYCRMQDG
jgi:hypothetical protein